MSGLNALAVVVIMLLGTPLNNPWGTSVGRQARASRILPQDVSFEEKSAVHGIADDGYEFSSTTWESSDGAGVFLQIKYCRSAANAVKVFRQLAKSAAKIFERSVLTDKNGRRTGERIVVAFGDREPLLRREKIVWTKGDEVYILESTSFEHALIFEKKWRDRLV